MVTVPTPDGGRLELAPVGALVDVRVMDSTGRTLATVAKPAHEVALLLACADELPDVPELPGVLRILGR